MLSLKSLFFSVNIAFLLIDCDIMLSAWSRLPLREGGLPPRQPLTRHACHLGGLGRSHKTEPAAYRWDNNTRDRSCLLQYTLAGEGCFRDGQAQRTFALPAGTAFLVSFPSNTQYWLPAGGEWTFAYITFAGEPALYHTQELNRRFGYIFDLGDNSPAATVLLEIHQNTQPGGASDAYALSGRIYQLLMELYRGAEPDRRDLPPAVTQACALVESQYDRTDMGVEAMAAAAGYSRYHFSRLFRQHIGVPPHEYLLQVRMQQARNLLTATDLPIKQIGQMVGFGDYAYFCNSFRRRLGMPPGAVRRQGRRFG